MKLFDVYCDQCGWQSNRPVSEEVAREFCRHRCRGCKEIQQPEIRYKMKEHIIVGPTQFYPRKE